MTNQISQHSTIKSINPATKELLGEVPCLGQAEVQSAVDTAHNAFKTWHLTTYKQRAQKINNLKKLILSQADEIAKLITHEVGKPLVESLMAELNGPLDACNWFAKNTQRTLKDQIIALDNPILFSKQSFLTFEPLGVIGIISPWNYPFAIPMMTIIMALMTGNTVVLKPSEHSSLVGIKISDLFIEAGFPKGCVTVITGDKKTGAWLSKSNLARIVFTGSAAGGSKVMSQAAENLTPITLELGGKDAAIVLPDAPAEWTANGLIWSAFTNCGQACASVERVYLVQGSNTNLLIDNLVQKTLALKLGSGLDANTQVGPLISEEQLQKVAKQVDEAIGMGAKILCGGNRRDDLGGYFYEPTVLINVNHHMSIMQEETFGPVLPIMVVDSEDKAISLANDSAFGLSASVWSKDLSRAEDIAEDLEVGTVTINDSLFPFACPQLPWGGLKKSGTGRTHSTFGLMDLVNIKHISIDAAGGMHRQWWYPYNRSRIRAARAGLDFLHGKSLLNKLRGAFEFIANSFFGSK